jgi:outer membrane receptor protein involved in Fe transport
LGNHQTHGIQYEGGVKLDAWRNRLRATASWFYLYKDNLPVISIGSYVRGANQLSRGAELDLTGQFTSNWSAIVSYAFDKVGYAYGKLSADAMLPVKPLRVHAT